MSLITDKNYPVLYKRETIETVSLELVNTCNLQCPACDRQIPNHTNTKNKYLPREIIINFLKEFPYLKTVEFMGTISEPTLWQDKQYAKENGLKEYQLPELIKDIKVELSHYNQIEDKTYPNIYMSTNGSTRGPSGHPNFFKRLATTIDCDDNILFGIDGHTQELHQIYRVNSNLDLVMENARDVKIYSSANVWGLHLHFQHNFDVREDTKKFIEENDLLYLPRVGDLGFDCGNKVQGLKQYGLTPKAIQRNAQLMKYRNFSYKDISCECVQNYNVVYITVDGVLNPCCYFNNGNNRKTNIYKDTTDKCLRDLDRIIYFRRKLEVCKFSCTKLTKKIENRLRDYFYKDVKFTSFRKN